MSTIPNIGIRHHLAELEHQNNWLKKIDLIIEKPVIRAFFTKGIKQMKLLIKIRHRLKFSSHFSFFSKMRLWNRIKNRYRYLFFSHKIGGHDGRFNIQTGVVANNPKCVFLGKNVCVGANTFFNAVTYYQGTRYNPVIKIGEGTSIGRNCTLSSIIRVEIGKHVLFASQIHITDHSHGYQDIDRPIGPQRLTTKGPVIIEDDCWLGFGCEILSGVHIGKHCVVAARAVVTKDVPSYSVVAGNPARIVKQYNFQTQQWESVKNDEKIH